MAVNVHSDHNDVVDCEDAVLLATPLDQCPEEPYASQECVLTEDLAPIINAWLEREIADAQQQQGGRWMPNVGPRSLLCERAGIPERRLFGILQQEQASVGLDTADRILLAIDATVQDVPVYLTSEVRLAALVQTELIRTISQTIGHFIPVKGADARMAIPQARRKMTRGK